MNNSGNAVIAEPFHTVKRAKTKDPVRDLDRSRVTYSVFRWDMSEESTRRVVEEMLSEEDYTSDGWEQMLRDKAETAFDSEHLDRRIGLSHNIDRLFKQIRGQSIEVNNRKDVVAETPSHMVGDSVIRAPEGWSAVTAFFCLAGTLGLVVWTIGNTATMLLPATDDFRKAVLLSAPLALCPVLTKLLVERFPTRWTEPSYRFLAGFSVLAFLVWAGCLAVNNLSPVSSDDVLSDNYGPKFLGLQLGAQIAMEIGGGSVLFAKFLSCFRKTGLSVHPDRIEAEQELETEMVLLKGLESALDDNKECLSDFKPKSIEFAERCVEAGQVWRKIIFKEVEKSEELRRKYEKVLAGSL